MKTAAAGRSIFPLPSDVRAQIQSSITITSLEDVVVELVKNALDAEATEIKIHLDSSKGACEVKDNGVGIPPADFGADGSLGRQFRKRASEVYVASADH